MYDVAVIGTGPDPSNPTTKGFAMGYRHAEAYRDNDHCQLVACADIVPENGDAFAEAFDIENTYEDFAVMLEEVEPDIVSVTVPPSIHETIVVKCATNPAVEAIHCEKPMAHTWASAQRMVQSCWRNDTQLTFNRQRRFAKPFSMAKSLIEKGEIGDLRRIEIGWGDFYDTGAHTIDLAGMFNDDLPAKWVVTQLDYREEDIRFGAHQENQIWAQWKYANDVFGVMTTGSGSEMLDAAMILRGTEGTIRVDKDEGAMLELERGNERTEIDVDGENMHNTGSEPESRLGSFFQNRSIDHVIESLQNGDEPMLSGRIGLNTSEIIFAGYESVRKRGRVELPLTINDNPFEEMVESGALDPKDN